MQDLYITDNSKAFGFLSLAFCFCLITANWFDPLVIGANSIITGGGALIYPFTYAISCIMTEVYGFKNTRTVICVSFLVNLLIIIISISLSKSGLEIREDNFHIFIESNLRIIIASGSSYIASEFINSYLLSKMKLITHGKYLGIRFFISIITSQFINVLIFCPIAFIKILNTKELFNLMITSFFLMLSIEVIALPIAIRLAKKLKKIESIEATI